MINKLKKLFYFPLAYYFRFFAKIQLLFWKPRIVVVTGSSGKTTLLHLIESQIKDRARYSHYANSSYGIPFDILGLRRKNLTINEWPYLILAAPFKAFKKPYKEKLYIVEADCDRPNEGKFLAELLKPEVTLWISVSRTHTINFDTVVKNNKFPNVEQVIAHEFGYFLEETKELAIINGDYELINQQAKRSKARIATVTQKELNDYKVFEDHTEFKINGKDYRIRALLPKEAFYSIAMTNILLDFIHGQLPRHSGNSALRSLPKGSSRISLHPEVGRRDSGVAPTNVGTPQNDDQARFIKIKPNYLFSQFKMPPGRSSKFVGIKNTTIIDSTYNATPEGVKAILNMFALYPADKKWLVLGDIIELGEEEQEEHEKLADQILSMKLDNIVLVGPRLKKYTSPRLNPPAGPDLIGAGAAQTFLMPKEALDYLTYAIQGGEVLLFKGARFLEGIIEHLLADKNDAKKLVRRELVWRERRKKWGL